MGIQGIYAGRQAESLEQVMQKAARERAQRQQATEGKAQSTEKAGGTQGVAEQEQVLKVDGKEQKERPRLDEYIPGDAAEKMAASKEGSKPEKAANPEAVANSEKAANPEAAANPEKSKELEKPEKSEKAESCTGNTDKVDREIEKLKKKKEKLKEQIRACEDGEKKEDLEKQLAQVEAQLRQKDNDSYRRQHSQFS